MSKKIYDFIKELLQKDPIYRNSDRELLWAVWEFEGNVLLGTMTKEMFLKSMSTKTITRARRKVQEDHPELGPNKTVKGYRKQIEKQKGTHVYREKIVEFDNVNNIAKIRYKDEL